MKNKKVKEITLKQGLTCWLPSVVFLLGIVFAHVAMADEKSSSNLSAAVGDMNLQNIMLERQSAMPPPGPYRSILFVADFIPKPVSIAVSNKTQKQMTSPVHVHPALQPRYPNTPPELSNKNQYRMPPKWVKQPGHQYGRPAMSAHPRVPQWTMTPNFNTSVRAPSPPRYAQIPDYRYPPVRMTPPIRQPRSWQQYPQSRSSRMTRDNVERK